MLPPITAGYKPYEPKVKRGFPKIYTLPLAVVFLTICSGVFDYLRYGNLQFCLTQYYAGVLVLYAFSWLLTLWCGRGVTFFFLVLNFIVFMVMLGGHQVVTYSNAWAILNSLPAYIHFSFFETSTFWILAGLTVTEMVLVLPYSHFNFVKSFSVIFCIIALFLGLEIFKIPNKYLLYPLWPGVYDAFHSSYTHVVQQAENKPVPVNH